VGEMGTSSTLLRLVTHLRAGVRSASQPRRPETTGEYETVMASLAVFRTRYHILRIGPPIAAPKTAIRSVRFQLYDSFSGDMMSIRHSKNWASMSPTVQKNPDVTAFVRTGYSLSMLVYQSQESSARDLTSCANCPGEEVATASAEAASEAGGGLDVHRRRLLHCRMGERNASVAARCIAPSRCLEGALMKRSLAVVSGTKNQDLRLCHLPFCGHGHMPSACRRRCRSSTSSQEPTKGARVCPARPA
jgi:hypothetical protein